MFHHETPLLRYWRLLNAALESLQAPPVMFGDAIAIKSTYRDPRLEAHMMAQAQRCGERK